MGQAAVELPDPLTNTPAPATSADDLLSQLAGEEIDRLLKEAEVEDAPTPAPGEQAAPRVDPAPRAQPSVSSETKETVDVFSPDGEVRQAAVPTVAAAQPPPAPTQPPASDQVDKLASTESPAPAASVAQPEEAGTSTAERTALDGVAEILEAQARADDACAEASTDQGLPIYLKPLQWLNAPLSLFPSSVRETIGKVAILTLFNAIAVIVYVLVFRRAH
jgi:hypothetical protein